MPSCQSSSMARWPPRDKRATVHAGSRMKFNDVAHAVNLHSPLIDSFRAASSALLLPGIRKPNALDGAW